MYHHCSSKRVFVVHGGLYSKYEEFDLDWVIENVRKPTDTKNYQENPFRSPQEDLELLRKDSLALQKAQIVEDLLWSDPKENLESVTENKERGQGCCFGVEDTKKFLMINDLSYMIRSHETVDEGIRKQHDGKCVTVFSAPNYCNVHTNRGAVMVIDRDDL